MHDTSYSRLIQHIDPWFPELDFHIFQKLNLRQRSAVVSLARSRVINYDPNLKLVRQIHEDLSRKLCIQLMKFNKDPFTSALMRCCAIWAPVDEEEYRNIKTLCIEKELRIHQRQRKPPRINYSAFFGSPYVPIHPEIPANPKMAKQVQAAIDNWKMKIRDCVIFPQLSNKTMSDSTTRSINEQMVAHGYPGVQTETTKRTLEKLHHDHPWLESEGVCEMRQRHYMGYVKPRTYFCIGDEAHAKSKWASKISSRLADELLCTNQIQSLRPSRLQIQPDDKVLIYDLSGFTSNLDEHEYFLRELADYCCDTTVRIVDPVSGITPVPLNHLISDLADVHVNVPFSTHRVDNQMELLFSGPGGFLGIGGNIQTARFLHGSVVLQSVDSIHRFNCAGDDGLIATKNKKTTMSAINLVGALADSKVFDGREDGAIALKRPVEVVNEHILLHDQMMLPNFEMMSDSTILDKRYPLFAAKTISERQSSAAGSVVSSAVSYHLVDTAYSREYLQLCRLFYQMVPLPQEGCIPQLVRTSRLGVVLPIDLILVPNPINMAIDRMYTGTAYLNCRGLKTRPVITGYIGEKHEVNWTSGYSYVETLGKIQQNILKEVVHGEAGLHRLKQEFLDPEPQIVEMEVTDTLNVNHLAILEN